MTESIEPKPHSFWKKITNNIPGKPNQKKDPANKCSRIVSVTSYHDLQDSISDSWKIKEKEFEVKVSKYEAEVAAVKILRGNGSNATARNEDKISTVNQSLVSASKPLIGSHRNDCMVLNRVPGRAHVIKNEKTERLTWCKDETDKKRIKFEILLTAPIINLEDLRGLSWLGVPVQVRALTWKLLSRYLPTSLDKRQEVVDRKRRDYWVLVEQYFNVEKDNIYKNTFKQIHMDVPRMSPLIPIFQQKAVQEMFERILLVWAIRHPASGYVQGINDLLTPFYVVYLQAIIPDCNINQLEISNIPRKQLNSLEADSFWCFSKFLEEIQDNYIFDQTGIQQKVCQLRGLIQRIDKTLHNHLQENEVDYLQFSFRWLNNMLIRELPLHCTIRLWDIYLAEAGELATFQPYICASFLLSFRNQLLLEKDFQGLMLLLQNLPTKHWQDSDVNIVVAEAYRLQYTFAGAPNHLTNVPQVKD